MPMVVRAKTIGKVTDLILNTFSPCPPRVGTNLKYLKILTKDR